SFPSVLPMRSHPPSSPTVPYTTLFRSVLYTLRRADDALILGHRLSEWCGHAPMLEEDMALSNMALDLIGQARELYGNAAKVEGRSEEHTSELQSHLNLVCRLLLEKTND